MGTKPQSMTGFGSAEIARDGVTCRCDIRSVNGKGLDIKLRLPNGLEALEQPIKKAVAARLTRGNLQLFLAIERGGQAISAISIDKDLFRTLVAASTALAAETGIAPPTADAILAMRGVVTTDEASG
ncbi:MAG: YicC/YloC family endoribonuclease, partial [Pseudomonadota bacterium]